MNAGVVVAICATVIAVLSLAVSVYEARATRRHNRISVRPFLELRVGLPHESVYGGEDFKVEWRPHPRK